MASGEFIDALMKILKEVQCDDSAARKVEIRIKQQFGGARVYIGKKETSASGKVSGLAAAVAAGTPLRTAFSSVGVKRSQGYVILSKPWRR